ncbi:MAG TPA: acyl-protein synthetase [Polyangiaceae bacterium]
MNRNERSDELHAKVQRFARGDQALNFADLAREITEFQREFSPGFARLLVRLGRTPNAIEEIPGVPCDAFRVARVALHAESEDLRCFATSGTTGGARGTHALRRIDTYREVALSFGRRALLADDRSRRVVALAPRLDDPPTSSLGHMMALFMSDFEGSVESEIHSPERWLIGEHGVDLEALERAARDARDADQTLIVLATSFALVALLDALAGRAIAAPARTVIMQTGGFKGKSREIAASELRRAVAESFGIDPRCVVAEYGMTELTSQLYEATLPGSALEAEHHGMPGVYFEPPWLRVVPVDPVGLEPVAPGETGIARIVDLANIDSALAIQTQDRVRRVNGGIELLGRAPGATPRGCSLTIEEFLQARSP